MKNLTKIRLINWHYFENETINVKGNILMTGENASGKSTILDAVSYVLTAGDQNFNLAANEKGKRDLKSYCKCALGSLEQAYLRDYDLSSHICLEFYSEKQEKFFCLGVIIDCIGNVQPPKSTFYIVDSQMKEEFFVNEEYKIRSSSDFKKCNYTTFIYTTRKEAKSAFRAKMGGLSEKYFTLIPKAIAFKPITDVKDYIYNHLLEEKTINVKNIQESIRSYKEFETILKTTKSKIEDLKRISESYFAIKEIKDNEVFYNYLLSDLKRNDNNHRIEQKTKLISKLEKEQQDIGDSIKEIVNKIDSEDERSKELYAALSLDSEFKADEIYSRDIKKAENEYKLALEKSKEFERRCKAFSDNIEQIEVLDKEFYKELKKLKFEFSSLEEVNTLKTKLNDAKSLINAKKDEVIKNETSLGFKKNEILEKIQNVFRSLSTLSKNDIPYRPEIVELRQKMEEHLYKVYNENIRVYILAEVLEVKDPSWQNTVEDFLGNQRFTLLVEPKYYDDCLDCYNEYKSKKIFGINLLNTKKIQSFTNYEPNSLASIIETENKDARCYINYFCGQLIMVDDVHDLDRHNQSITKSGMLYRGFTTRYLNPNTEKPFIGKNARDEQSKKFTVEGELLKQDFQKISEEIKKVTDLKEIIAELNIEYLAELSQSLKDVLVLDESIKELNNKKEELSLSNVNDLRKEYENMLEGIRVLNARKDTLNIEFGTKRQAIDQVVNEIKELNNENDSIALNLKVVEAQHIDFKDRTEKLFNEELEKGKNAKEIEDFYKSEVSNLISSLKPLESGLNIAELGYITKYNRPLSTGYQYTQEYLDELDKLERSELVKYEAKVRESREQAEKLFKEDFLSKLRSYILEAQDEMSKINETLNRIVFGNDRYQFVFPKSKEYSAIYDMICSDINSETGYSIFDVEFEKKYNQELDELFNNLTLDEGDSQGNLNKYTDYRTYMDYDLKIESNEDTFYLSNIAKSTSGAETQIPFYVAILASFVRLFDKAEKNGVDDCVGLIMFDEVFDKMDPNRINSMMDFICNLNVQIILACPPQKMDTLSRKTDTTIAVTKNGRRASALVASIK